MAECSTGRRSSRGFGAAPATQPRSTTCERLRSALARGLCLCAWGHTCGMYLWVCEWLRVYQRPSGASVRGPPTLTAACFPPRARPHVPEAWCRAAEPAASALRESPVRAHGPHLASSPQPDGKAACRGWPGALLPARGDGAKVGGRTQAGGEEKLAHGRL